MKNRNQTTTSSETPSSHRGFASYSRDLHRLLSFVPLRPYQRLVLFGGSSRDLAVALGKTLWNGHLSIVTTNQKDANTCQEAIRLARLSNVSVTNKTKPITLAMENSLDGIIVDVDSSKNFQKNFGLKTMKSWLLPGGWMTVIVSEPASQTQASGQNRVELLSSITKAATTIGFRLKQERDLESSFAILIFNKPSIGK